MGAAGTLPLPMETTVEALEGNKVRLRVAVPASEFESAIDAAFRKLAREVRIPGFRPGKAPRRLLEAHLGTEIAREQAIRDSVPDYYLKAVEVEDLDTIAPPEFEITSGQEEGDVEFDAVVEVRPQAEIEGYDSLQVPVKETKRKVLPEATDEWVQEASEFDTLDQLKADIRTRMESVRRIQAHLAVRDKVLQAVGAKVAIDIPEPLVQEEMERRLH